MEQLMYCSTGWGSYVWRENADQCLQNHEDKRQFMHSSCSHTRSSGSLTKVVEDQMKRDKGRYFFTQQAVEFADTKACGGRPYQQFDV